MNDWPSYIPLEMQTFALTIAGCGIMVSGIVLIAARLLRRRSEPLRYAVLLGGVLGLLAIPALVSVSPRYQSAPELIEEIVRVPLEMLPQLLDRAPAEAEEEAPSLLGPTIGTVLLTLWTLGAAVGLSRLLWALWKQHRAIAGQPWRPTWWTEDRKTRLAEQLGLRRFPDVFVAPAAPMPMVLGIVRPMIVLPEASPASWDQPQWEAVLLHEAAHIARRDHWAVLAQRSAIVLFWWCPLVYLVSRRLNELRENICDDYALQGSCDRIAYAELLVESAEQLIALKALPVPLGLLEAARCGLEARITRLLEKERPMTKLSLFGKVLAAGFLVAACLLTTAATAFSQAQPQPQKKVQIKIIIDGKEIDLGDVKLWQHIEAAQKQPASEPQKDKGTTVKPGQPGVAGVTFTPDGKLLATSDGARVFLWDVATGQVVAQPGQTPIKPDPRIEELVKQAEAIKPGSGADVRKALQGAVNKMTYQAAVADYYRALTVPSPVTGTVVKALGDKKIIILSIQDGKVQQLNDQDLKKYLEQGQIHFRFSTDTEKKKDASVQSKPAPTIELKTAILPPKTAEKKQGTTWQRGPESADLEALSRQLERITAELLELKKRVNDGKAK